MKKLFTSTTKRVTYDSDEKFSKLQQIIDEADRALSDKNSYIKGSPIEKEIREAAEYENEMIRKAIESSENPAAEAGATALGGLLEHIESPEERGKGKKLSLIKAAALKKKAKTYFDDVVEKYGAISDELNKDDNTEDRKDYLRGVKKLLQDAQTDLRRDINVL